MKEILEKLEDGLGFQSLLFFLVPALSGDLPDSRGDSGGFEASWLRWSLPFRDNDGDVVIRIVGKRHLPGCKLEGERIRVWIPRTPAGKAYLNSDHCQRVHVGLIRRFPLHILNGVPDVEELRGTVPDRATLVGGRGVN